MKRALSAFVLPHSIGRALQYGKKADSPKSENPGGPTSPRVENSFVVNKLYQEPCILIIGTSVAYSIHTPRRPGDVKGNVYPGMRAEAA